MSQSNVSIIPYTFTNKLEKPHKKIINQLFYHYF
ncbi:hypothetical protein TpMuguga_03g02585 [Theileria parva strain Muguga]|nr:uncharacterized protein TpMuguga_03g02585 [Theileria parva strain Muguga]KAF5153150.1 hypothetical protein TpMuguga_03g02585 [Theileria parva strain Muguga]